MKYAKISTLSLFKLNNLEFTNFFHRFRLLVRAKGAEPTEATRTFINQVNVLISETSAAYNQRKAQAKKTSK